MYDIIYCSFKLMDLSESKIRSIQRHCAAVPAGGGGTVSAMRREGAHFPEELDIPANCGLRSKMRTFDSALFCNWGY